MRLTYDADRVRMPLRSELKKKHEQIKALRDRGMTNVSQSSRSAEDPMLTGVAGGDPATD